MYLKLDIDGADGKALHPYPWIPPTGNVMYCMPQEGTEAYLYFPEAEEESAYAVSEIHNSRCPVFADAQRRELVTEHGKKLRLHADRLFLLLHRLASLALLVVVLPFRSPIKIF